MQKIKYILLTALSTLMLFASTQNVVQNSSADFNPVSWIVCRFDSTKMLYKAATTDWIPYMIRSKTSLASTRTNGEDSNNIIMSMAGFKFGGKQTNSPNIFQKVGLSGIEYSSYLGEWKYYDIDPCEENSKSKASDYGEYYKDRKDPQSTYGEVNTSRDPRTKQFAQGFFSAWWAAIKLSVNNFFLGISKFISAITITLFGLAFTDVSDLLGLTQDFQEGMFQKLYSNLFMPLVTLVFLLTAMYILYYGIIKREYRTSLIGGLVKPLLAFSTAIVFAANITWITIPNKLATLGTSLVTSALVSNVKSSTSDLCDTSTGAELDITSSKFLDEANERMKNIIACNMYVEFVFKPWARGQFGTDYDQLDAIQLQNINKSWVGEPNVVLGDKKIANWALFQVDLQSGYHAPIDEIDSPLVGGVDKDWYRIVDALSNYDEIVKSFGSSSSGGSGGPDGDLGGSSGGVDIKTNPDHWSTGDPYTHDLFTKRDGITEEQIDGYLAKSGIPFDKSRVNGKNFLAWQKASGVDVRALIAIALWESSYGTAGVAISGNMWNYAAFDSDPGASLAFNDSIAIVKMANETLINNKNRNFKRQDDKALANANGTLRPEDGGVYFTDTSGHGKKRAETMAEIDAYIDAHGGAADKATNTEPGTGQIADSDIAGSLSGGSSSGSGKIYEQINSKPLDEWSYWTGNKSGERFNQTFISMFLTIVGSILPLLFALLCTIYGLGITILTIVAPIFLLLGCWGGRGQSILRQYFGTVLSTMLKKVIASFLLVISVIINTNLIAMINSVGLIQSLVFTMIISYVLFKNRATIIDRFSQTSLGQINLSGFSKGVNVFKSAGKLALGLGASAAAGGIEAKKIGGQFSSGMSSGVSTFIKNKAYTTQFGRNTMQGYAGISEKHTKHICVNCGREIGFGDIGYRDDVGNYYCSECASVEGYEKFSEIIIEEENNSNRNYQEEVTIVRTETTKDGQKMDFAEQFHQPTYKDMRTVMKVTTNDWDREETERVIKNSLATYKAQLFQDTNSPSNYMLSTKKGEKPKQVIFKDIPLPDPIRAKILGSNASQLIAQGRNREFYDLVENAWKDWYVDTNNSRIKTNKIKKEDLTMFDYDNIDISGVKFNFDKGDTSDELDLEQQ